MQYKDLVKKLQTAMNAQGESLTVDGDPGPKTQAALTKFDVTIGLTKSAPVVTPTVVSDGKRPIDWARTQLGQKEVSGSKDNPVIQEYHSHARLGSSQHDEVPWCSSFLNAAADATGMEKTNDASAISWKKYVGDDTGDLVEEGDVILLTPAVSGSTGHVTMANKAFNRSKDKSFEGIGGNQSNSVCVASYPTSRIVVAKKWKPKAGAVVTPPVAGKIGVGLKSSKAASN